MIRHDDVGLIYEVNNIDPGNLVSTPLEGWHVNTTDPIADWAEYLVTPETPRQVFNGLSTYCYRFPDEATYQLLKGEDDAEGSI